MTKRFAPATERNREPIAAVLRDVLPSSGLVLEIASGSGEHIIHFANAFPALDWQPSDTDPNALASIAAWAGEVRRDNLLPPIKLDASANEWPIAKADVILCINMVHISPWAATQGLMAGASRLLPPGGLLFLYGPYHQAGVLTAPSNEAFNESLKSRNSEWGLRRMEDIVALAAHHALVLDRSVVMPANNLSLILRMSGAS